MSGSFLIGVLQSKISILTLGYFVRVQYFTDTVKYALILLLF